MSKETSFYSDVDSNYLSLHLKSLSSSLSSFDEVTIKDLLKRNSLFVTDASTPLISALNVLVTTKYNEIIQYLNTCSSIPNKISTYNKHYNSMSKLKIKIKKEQEKETPDSDRINQWITQINEYIRKMNSLSNEIDNLLQK